jgi:Cu-processing system ATP-binding protein
VTPVVHLHHVTRRFGATVAVDTVDLDLLPGECVGLVGHNGAGKSTLIRLMLGLIRPTAGTVRVLGGDPAAGTAARARRELGYLPENVALQPSLTGAEALAFYARLKGLDVAGNAALFERVGLAQAARRRIGTYSKGMRQRLGLAQAMLGHPRVLLLDEPTTGLDPELRQGLYEIVRAMRDGGTAVLLSSHALAELEGEVDRVVVMNRGKKMADGDLHALRRLAGLPTRLRIRIAELCAAGEGLPERTSWIPAPGGMLELACRDDDVVPLLRRLPPGTEHVDILRPSLDEVYASFLRNREGEDAA